MSWQGVPCSRILRFSFFLQHRHELSFPFLEILRSLIPIISSYEEQGLTDTVPVTTALLPTTPTTRKLLPPEIFLLETHDDSTLTTGAQLPPSTATTKPTTITTRPLYLPSQRHLPETCTAVPQASTSPRPARLTSALQNTGESTFFVALLRCAFLGYWPFCRLATFLF